MTNDVPTLECVPRERADRRGNELKRLFDAGLIRNLRRWGYHSAKGDSTRIEWRDAVTGEARVEVFE